MWTDSSDCGYDFQVGETYLVYADEDEALLNIWVDEQMAHPRVAGAWTLDGARKWVMNWQRMFADRSQMILEGKTLDELRAGIPYAERIKAKEIYLFTQTWRRAGWNRGEPWLAGTGRVGSEKQFPHNVVARFRGQPLVWFI